MGGQTELFATDGRVERATPAATRRAAHEAIQPVSGEQRRKVLAALTLNPAGLTTEEIQIWTHLGGDSCRPRLLELRQAGLVKESGETRKTIAGRDAVVWIAVNP